MYIGNYSFGIYIIHVIFLEKIGYSLRKLQILNFLQQYPHIPRSFGEMDGVEIFQQRDCVFTGGFG